LTSADMFSRAVAPVVVILVARSGFGAAVAVVMPYRFHELPVLKLGDVQARPEW